MIQKLKKIEIQSQSLDRIFVGNNEGGFFTIEKANGTSKISWFDSNFGLKFSRRYEDISLSLFGSFDKHNLLLEMNSKNKFYIIDDVDIIHLDQYDIQGWKYSNSLDAVSSKYILIAKVDNGKILYSLVDIKEGPIDSVTSCSLHLYRDSIYNRKDLKLQRLDEKTLKPLWSKDYTDDLDHIEGMNRVIHPIIGVHSGVFVFSYQGKWLVGVNVDTGEIAWKLRGSWSRSQLLENGNIFIMVGSQMRLVDVKTGQLIGEYGEIEGEIGPQRMNYTFIGHHVILTGRPSDTIGAYNTKTYKYDWIYKEEGTQWSPQPMKYYHPYLFVNDTKGNLHVFKVDDEMNIKKEV